MDYKLAKKLKNAGFVQRKWKYAFYYVEGLKNKAGEDMIVLYCDLDNFKGEKVYIPDLKELIETCEEDFANLRKYAQWEAEGGKYLGDAYEEEWEFLQKGETPEEAVANLWIELNKK